MINGYTYNVLTIYLIHNSAESFLQKSIIIDFLLSKFTIGNYSAANIRHDSVFSDMELIGDLKAAVPKHVI